MKDKSDVDAFLAEHGWLSFTPKDFSTKVLQRIELHEFAKGQAVYRAGDAPGGLWALVEGTVEIESGSPGGP